MQVRNLDLDTALLARDPPTPSPQARQTAIGAGNYSPPTSATPPSTSIDDAIDSVNRQLEVGQRSVRVVSRPGTSAPVIEIVDVETDQVVRQIPPEQVLKLAAWWEENGLLSQNDALGLAIDETA